MNTQDNYFLINKRIEKSNKLIIALPVSKTIFECKTIYTAPSKTCEECEGVLNRIGSYDNNQLDWLICEDCEGEWSYNSRTTQYRRI